MRVPRSSSASPLAPRPLATSSHALRPIPTSRRDRRAALVVCRAAADFAGRCRTMSCRPSPTTTIIDVGCGTGANLAALADEYRCVGIDTSADAIRLAKQRFPQTEFIQGYAPDDLGRTVDEARAGADDRRAGTRARRFFAVLGGGRRPCSPARILLITVPADLRLWSGHDESFGHYRRYDARRLAKIWEDLPIEPLLVSHFNRRLYPLIKGVRAVNRWRGPGPCRRPGGNRFQNSARSGEPAAGKHFRRRVSAFSAGRCEPAGAVIARGSA